MNTMMTQVLVPGLQRFVGRVGGLDMSAPLVFTIADVLTVDERATMIARIDALGPTDAPVTTARGPLIMPELRNNQRVMFDDVAFAGALFGRVRSALPAQLHGRRPAGVNERFRCYRYAPGQRFAPHYDGAFCRNPSEQSELTFMVYLNDGFVGGRTVFLDHGVEVAPRAGLALLFQHQLLHEGCEVEAGVKYVLRSDVMYAD